MFRTVSVVLGVLATATNILAGPLLGARQSTSVLSAADVASFKQYTYFASAAYCLPETTRTWTCGPNCDHNSGFKPIASGGDGAFVQYWYVGYDPRLASIIVGFQGTATEKLIPILTDGNFRLDPLDPTLFPGVSPYILTHDGFGDAHDKSARRVLAAVRLGLTNYTTTHVTVVGHSLGGAIAAISSSYLSLHLPSGTTFKTVTYGMPRVGNQLFANFANGKSDMTRINNKRDPIPTLPYRVMGFAHTEGEIHITASNQWVSCPGQDNESPECTIATVPLLANGDINDHSGPYDGVTMGC
jgi:hypothetical protein